MVDIVKSIKDPIHGYIGLTSLELELIDTLPLQRLRRIKQLPGSEYVYPGAMNTRFEHSLGVMHLAGLMGNKLSTNKDVVILLRIAGLLHDIGHGPFSHSFEPILNAFLRISHEEMGAILIKNTVISDILGKNGIDVSDVTDLILGKYKRKSLSRIINSPIDADKMDYTVRDSYHTGAGYSVDIRRIAMNAMDISGDLAINVRALEAIESLLMARLLSFRTIYYHKTSRAVQLMLERAMTLVVNEMNLNDILENPDFYLNLDDYTMWEILRNNEKSKDIMKKLVRRHILKVAREWYGRSLSTKQVDQLRSIISNASGVPEDDIIIDSPKIKFIKSTDLPPLWRDGELINPLDASPVLSKLKDLIPSMIRIYTWPRYRNKLKDILRNKNIEDFL